jgi:hypothetical protein
MAQSPVNHLQLSRSSSNMMDRGDGHHEGVGWDRGPKSAQMRDSGARRSRKVAALCWTAHCIRFLGPRIAALLLQAQASGAKVLALCNGGADTVASVKQAREFGS